MSEIDGLLELLINSFKRSKNLPYTIKTNMCPKYNKYCKRHHGEIVVTSYNSELNKFHCIVYGVHVPKSVLEYDQTEDVLRKMIKKSVTTMRRNKSLVLVKELKKIIRSGEKLKNNIKITFRCTEEQKEIIRSDAKKNGFSEISDYIKLKLLS